VTSVDLRDGESPEHLLTRFRQAVQRDGILREIKNGKLGDLIKNPTYTGITPRFWGSCDAIGNRDLWVVWGTPNCGKGQPEQVAHTGHGASAARFRNVRVGVMQ
jgi:TldD protein